MWYTLCSFSFTIYNNSIDGTSHYRGYTGLISHYHQVALSTVYQIIHFILFFYRNIILHFYSECLPSNIKHSTLRYNLRASSMKEGLILVNQTKNYKTFEIRDDTFFFLQTKSWIHKQYNHTLIQWYTLNFCCCRFSYSCMANRF